MSAEGPDATLKVGDPQVDDEFASLLAMPYPSFSDDEMDRRRNLLFDLADRRDVDHVVAYGTGGRGGAVTWLSQWLVTNEAHLVMSHGEPDALFVQYFNHVPLAQELVRDATVAWGGIATIDATIGELGRRGAAHGRVGVIGPLPFAAARRLEAVVGPVVDLTTDYFGLRLVKSEEELRWFKLGARLADRAIDALAEQLRPGLSERDLVSIVESAYLRFGAVNGIHYFALNAMNAPQYCTPRQIPSTRLVGDGDVLSTEITANFFDYGGQVLRTYSVGADLSPLFRDLHDVADEAYSRIAARLRPGVHAAELVDAANVIEEAGFTTLDDLVHGYGGGYLAPILGSRSRPNEPVPDMVLRSGMLIVVQPNVVTLDHRAGVQTGECLVVADGGAQRLHRCALGAYRV